MKLFFSARSKELLQEISNETISVTLIERDPPIIIPWTKVTIGEDNMVI
jgi:hypothetical protein